MIDNNKRQQQTITTNKNS